MSFRKETDWFIVCDCDGIELGPYKSEGEDPPEVTPPGWHRMGEYDFCKRCWDAYQIVKAIIEALP